MERPAGHIREKQRERTTRDALAPVLAGDPVADVVEALTLKAIDAAEDPIFTVDDSEWLNVLLSSRLAFA